MWNEANLSEKKRNGFRSALFLMLMRNPMTNFFASCRFNYFASPTIFSLQNVPEPQAATSVGMEAEMWRDAAPALNAQGPTATAPNLMYRWVKGAGGEVSTVK
jgi:hypothetical protein